ncbi:anthranilate synthase component I [Synechococcus sp. PCC 6312]|uniref:anthranilate synthase component I n=1 Tax=Synechococcus sp. (strain ATCC 27167 / PCC 6312) TaxID=195253 RepID=UPI00029F2670|nr:anthranilate synthase component I [Synechococcus sp. PCC 6312]AFY59505.1 aminodeoxychorismate synthase, component I, clade 2 [Synechococcus sp. PCC 6312]
MADQLLWQNLPLEGRTSSEIFGRLFLDQAIAVLLESPHDSDQAQARYSICAGNPKPGQVWIPELGQILPCLEHLFATTTSEPPDDSRAHLPFIGGWLGWLGYDLAWEIEQLPYTRPDSLPLPIAFWYEPACFAVLDHHQDQLWLAAGDSERLEELMHRLRPGACDQLGELSHSSCPRPNLTPPQLTLNQTDYEARVNQAKQYIHAGDIFQANLSLRFQVTGHIQAWSVYRQLQKINPSPFSCYVQTPWGHIVSCSPERLVQVHHQQVQTRPIAGTRPRGQDAQSDAQLGQELLSNAKERAEHIMLVDLERNDLGRVCQWGTVDVDELLVLETYSHVIHLVSNIRGLLKPGIGGLDVIKALFPGGTITGCPKVRCLEIIEELEPVRRNLFYGSCGYIDRRGHLDLNILIRTLLVNADQTQAWGQIGAGIVADSDPRREWSESLQKAQALFQALKTST